MRTGKGGGGGTTYSVCERKGREGDGGGRQGGGGCSVNVCIALCVTTCMHAWVGGVWMEEVREAHTGNNAHKVYERHTENNTHKMYERHTENNERKPCLQKLN